MVITLYAGLLGFIYVGLTFFTIKGRFKHRVGLGDGGNEDMARRIRMHGNFAEYVPMALILIFLVELSDFSEALIHGLGMALVLGRVLHAMGVYNVAPINKARQIGMVLTLSVIIVGSVLVLWSYLAG